MRTLSLSELTQEVYNALEEIFIILQVLWLSGESPGITKLDRLMNLSVLLKHSGNIMQLKAVLEELNKFSEGTAFAYVAKQHIYELSRCL